MGSQWPADKVERRPVSGLAPYARNARTHSEAQVAQIAASINEWGWTMPVLVDEHGGVIAGHGRILAAHKLGIVEVPVMVAEGWSEAQKRAYVIADNRIAMNSDWDEELLAVELGDLAANDFDLGLLAFDKGEVEALLYGDREGADGVYTSKIEAPTYEPSENKPDLRELIDETRTTELKREIDAADVPDEIKRFLRVAADRHTVFDFRKIADYYSHAPAEVQDLMENSALVIIDFDKAIAGGFVQLADKIKDQYALDHPDGSDDDDDDED